jgi:hypothetical protein
VPGAALKESSREIGFHDRKHLSSIPGGALLLADGTLCAVEKSDRAAVWTGLGRKIANGEPLNLTEACRRASSARGFERNLSSSFRLRERIFVAGQVMSAGKRRLVRCPVDGELIAAAGDPRAFVRSRSVLVVAFVGCELLACALCTRLALSRPLFGPLSTLGGASSLAFFLGVTPLGVLVRDLCRPHRWPWCAGTDVAA